MPSSTPKLAIPYPVGTDLISDGDNAIQALAERVEALMVPALADPALAANVINAFEGSKVYKSGGLMVFRMALQTNVALAAGATLATTPAGFRPPGTFRTVGWDVTAGVWAVNSYLSYTWLSSGILYCEAALPTGHTVVGTFTAPIT